MLELVLNVALACGKIERVAPAPGCRWCGDVICCGEWYRGSGQKFNPQPNNPPSDTGGAGSR